MENSKLSLADLIYIGLLFDKNNFIKKYINFVRQKRIACPCLVKLAVEDNNKSYLEDKIFILIRTTNTDPNFHRIVREMESNSNYYDKYQFYIDSVSHWVFIFNFPFNYTRDFLLVKEGKLSKISNAAKRKVINYWNFGDNGVAYNALYNIDNIRNSRGILMTRNELGEYFNVLYDPIPLETFRNHEQDL